MDSDDDLEFKVTKLRRKIRLIENLERLDRPLNAVEKSKVEKKQEFQQELQAVLDQKDNLYNHQAESSSLNSNVTTSSVSDERRPPSSLSSASSSGTNNEASKVKKPRYAEGDDTVGQSSQQQPADEVPSSSSAVDQPPESTAPSAPPLVPPNTRETTTSTDWMRDKLFRVRKFEGHSDLVLSVDADSELIVTGSRDTTVKVWNAETGENVRNLGGHTACVNCVQLLSKRQSDDLGRFIVKQNRNQPSQRFVISGSADCNVKIWSADTGVVIRNYYTFNAVRSLAYMDMDSTIITGCEGGKIEIWDAIWGENLYSESTLEDCITSIKVSTYYVYTTSSDGVVSAWEYRDRRIYPLFSSNEVKLSGGERFAARYIMSMAVSAGLIFYGDEGTNIKMVDWRKLEARKIRNHTCDYGATDAVYADDQYLVSSSYDIHRGRGSVNVRRFPDCRYVGSLNDGDTRRIFALMRIRRENGLERVVTAGHELKVWDEVPAEQLGVPPRATADTLRPTYDLLYHHQPQRDSDDEEEESDEDLEEEGVRRGWNREERTYNLDASGKPVREIEYVNKQEPSCTIS